MEHLAEEKACRGLGCFPRLRMTLKAAVTLFVLLCCFVVAAMVWRFGFSLGKSEIEAQLYGWLGVLGTVLKILLPFWLFAMGRKIYALLAQGDWQLRHGLAFVALTLGVVAAIPVWLLWTSLSLTSSLGFAAIHRAEAVNTGQLEEAPYAKMKHLSQKMDFIPRFRPVAILREKLAKWEQDKGNGLTQKECQLPLMKTERRCRDREVLENELVRALYWRRLDQERKALLPLLPGKHGTVSDSIASPARLGKEPTYGASVDSRKDSGYEMITVLRSKRKPNIANIFLTLGLELVSAFGLFLLFGNKRLKPVQEVG